VWQTLETTIDPEIDRIMHQIAPMTAALTTNSTI
jgi:hypothetical protein